MRYIVIKNIKLLLILIHRVDIICVVHALNIIHIIHWIDALVHISYIVNIIIGSIVWYIIGNVQNIYLRICHIVCIWNLAERFDHIILLHEEGFTIFLWLDEVLDSQILISSHQIQLLMRLVF